MAAGGGGVVKGVDPRAFGEDFPEWAWRRGLPKPGDVVCLAGGFDSMRLIYRGAERVGGEWLHLIDNGSRVFRVHGYAIREVR